MSRSTARVWHRVASSIGVLAVGLTLLLAEPPAMCAKSAMAQFAMARSAMAQSAMAQPPAQRVRNRRHSSPPPIPEGRAIGELDRRACERILEGHEVAFERVDAADAEDVEIPIRLTAKVGDVEVVHRDHGRRRRRRQIQRLEIMDCRLAVALLAWAPVLRASHVARVDHYSVYRPGARVSTTGQPSGHASGMAIDVGDLVLDDGTRIQIESDWTDKRRGVAPCPARADDAGPQRMLRELVCGAAASDLFQVVLTPHHDEDHENHVHLEVRPGVTWSVLE